jgi:hypothetical protein
MHVMPHIHTQEGAYIHTYTYQSSRAAALVLALTELSQRKRQPLALHQRLTQRKARRDHVLTSTPTDLGKRRVPLQARTHSQALRIGVPYRKQQRFGIWRAKQQHSRAK